MMYVTEVFDDKGRPVGKVSKCDHGTKWLAWHWREVLIGGLAAFLAASQIFV